MGRSRLFSAISSALLVVLLVACAGGSLLPRGNALSGRGNPVTPGGGAGKGAVLGAGLPALSKLAAPQRHLSLLGPGYFAIPITEIITWSNVTSGPGSITIDGGASLGFAVYGVYGFDGDNGPTSAKITASSVTGQYYVAFSDYVKGTWRSAGPFTGSAEVAIPNTDAYTSPKAFTSPKGTCYLAVLVRAGSSATLTGVELGVQGGVHGPEPTFSLGGSGEAPKFYLHWPNSPSYVAPDFAGYIVQRAPQFDGSFSDLTPTPTTQTFLQDSTAVQDMAYRYRICAQDVSGNRSTWVTMVGGPATGGKALPLVHLDLPRGPLYGPVIVTFNLSGSVDPMGEPITTYSLSFLTAPAPVSGASPTFNVTLQPGCYTISAGVECAGPPVRDASNSYFLVVYPRWQAAPTVVRDPGAPTFDLRRLKYASGTYNATAGRVTFCGFDYSNMGLCFWSAPEANPAAMTLARLPFYFPPTGVGRAFDVGSATLFPYCTSKGLLLASFDGAKASQQYLEVAPVTGKVAAAFDGHKVYTFYDNFDGVNTNLVCQSIPDGTSFTVVPATGGLTAIDALYNPATNTIDLVYGATSTEWVRVNIATASVANSASLDAVPADDIDLELDPATGRPMVLYSHTAIHRFRSLNALNIWTPEVQVDNTVANLLPLDLIVDDGTPYAYFRTGPAGQAVLYRDNGASWSPVNVVSFSANSGLEVALVPQPGSPDRGLVLDMDSTRSFHLAALHNDGTDTDLWDLPKVDGQGFDLQTTAGTDGLHAVWRSLGTGLTRHALSTTGGATWTDPGDIGPAFSDLGLAADTGGNVYFSASHGGNAELYWWDGAALNLRDSFPNSSSHRPFLSNVPDTKILWCAYDDATTTMHYVSANEPTYTDSPMVLTTTPVWEGVANTLGIDKLWFGLVGGAAPANGNVCWSHSGASSADKIYQPLLSSTFDLFALPLTWGRTFASTTYFGASPFPIQAMFCTRPRLVNPVIYTEQLVGPPESHDVVVGKDYTFTTLQDLFNDEVRDTASCSSAYSLTGVVLLCSGDGARSYLAWSHWGDWEELPLPAGLKNMSMPQIQVGLNGQWHIIYTDLLTDRMECWSTLP